MKPFAPLLLLAVAGLAHAQHEGHSMPGMTHPMPGMTHPMPPAPHANKPGAKKQAAKKAATRKAATARTSHAHHATPAAGRGAASSSNRSSHATHDRVSPQHAPTPAADAGHDMSGMDHAMHDMASMPQADASRPSAPNAASDAPAMHHAGHDMATTHGDVSPASVAPDAHAGHDMSAMSHAGHAMGAMPQAAGSDAHAGHAMPGMPADADASTAPRTPIPALTDADRAAAFPPVVGGHAAHDHRPHAFALVDRLEVADGGGGWETSAWYGGDIDRAWLRSEGEVADGHVADANVELLYGHLVSPWWDVVAGVRHDFGDGPSRTWAAVGVQGLAPYKFDVEATAYIGEGGRTAARLEGEYDTLLTNHLILQWRGEAELYGHDDPQRGIGRGLSTVAVGARLRYEVTRQFAPYVGVETERAFGRTADLRRDDGEAARETRIVAGLRLWF